MNRIKQKDIAKKVGISKSYISQLLSGDRRPSWKTAKRLASATSTPPVLWLEGSPDQIRQAISVPDKPTITDECLKALARDGIVQSDTATTGADGCSTTRK